jgi:GLPGLI family protein
MEMKLKDKPMKMNMVLDIDKDYTKFYDYDFLKNDSISKKTGENWQTNTQSDQLILRKANSNENRAFHDNMFDYFVIDSKDEMNWKIEKETKKNAEYSLQKATRISAEENGPLGFVQPFLFTKDLTNSEVCQD